MGHQFMACDQIWPTAHLSSRVLFVHNSLLWCVFVFCTVVSEVAIPDSRVHKTQNDYLALNKFLALEINQ